MSNTPQPSPDMQALNRLVGTWQLSGEAVGQVRYEWMPGGFFLIQHVEINHGGHTINGMEVIGHERLFGAEDSSPDIKSRFYDSEGNTLDYVYEIEGDTLTIWGGAKGSPAFYRGTFSADGNSVSGGWQWPGGGYSTTMTRLP
ncbi:MAG: hypothetical protein K8L91_29795 [Anaerolineae bacterium]|nr:hypothetical protein [Anaerolineae bacterium]